MSNEKLSPLRAAFIAAQAVLTALLQGIPTGRQDKPYLLLSLALALAGLLPPLHAMSCGAVCGALCDLSGSGVIGFFSLSAARRLAEPLSLAKPACCGGRRRDYRLVLLRFPRMG